jgi:hypothetical protein
MATDEWSITRGPTEVPAADADARLFRYDVARRDVRSVVTVAISGSLMASGPEGLAVPLGAIVATHGRAAVEDEIQRGRAPERITVGTQGLWSSASPIRYSAEGVEPRGRVQDTTALRYAIKHDDEELGMVSVPGAVGLINSGENIEEWIAAKLNEVQQSIGPQTLRDALAVVLEI